MDSFEFLGLSFGIVITIVFGVVVYLVILVNRRRKKKFLHREKSEH